MPLSKVSHLIHTLSVCQEFHTHAHSILISSQHVVVVVFSYMFACVHIDTV